MKKEVENINFTRFVNQIVPFEFITITELYERCAVHNYDLSTPHRIEFNALLIITKGNGTHCVDFKKEQLSPGVVIPLTNGQIHSFDNKQTIEGHIITFEENFITDTISEKNLFHFLHLYHTPRLYIKEVEIATLAPFLMLLDKVHKENTTYMKAEILNTAFMTLLFQIKRLTFDQEKIVPNQRFKDFIKFKNQIATSYHKTHNVKDYAITLSISYKYLNDICKQISNQTAKAFLDNWMLLEIKRSLLENRYTSQEIAFRMGFKEPSNFIRFFKNYTGLTPNQFQENLNKSRLG
ncbi:AraC family transcriptional regulator [Flavobacterium sp. 7A]|uniref:AraC family transcriptional regulator n=1 Tax=Flavobacterium sp. 7A TaxID=2940571 RepID=UPI002226A486|nr:helix-turn-helix transcriptional regulator [Flavobacterium sp. 7A]MCW2118164.1 AraC-like DNA-binding protein [Flavobacterium sp. 7A]